MAADANTPAPVKPDTNAPAIKAPDSNAADSNSLRQRMRGGFRSERVVIDFRDGIQRMYVSPRLTSDSNSIWLLPVKCKAEDIKFQPASDFPQFTGPGAREIASTILSNLNYALVFSQVWTIPLCHFEHASIFDPNGSAFPGRIDNNDLKIEVLKADSIAALVAAFAQRGKTLSPPELAPYEKYLTGDYAFLAAWKDGPAQASEPNRYSFRRRPSIFVEFPAAKPSYPVIKRDDSSRGPRIWITLTGFWLLDGQDPASAYAYSQMLGSPYDIPGLFPRTGSEKFMPYTSFNPASSAQPRDEFAFIPGRLPGMEYADNIRAMSPAQYLPLGIVGLALVSYISAGLGGLIIYRKWNSLAQVGLFNLLSIVAVGIALNYGKGAAGQLYRSDKKKGRLFLVCFSILVVALSFGAFALLKLPLGY
jgi:hypothetical protein